MKERFIGYINPTSYDIHLFHQGSHFRSFDFLGTHIKEYKGIKGISFTVWAPKAKEIRLVGNFNNWNGSEYPMKKVDDSGLWNIFIADLNEGEIYKYEIYTQDNRRLLKSDPYAFFSEVRPNTASRVANLKQYEWNDIEWLNERDSIYDKPLNIYELHLGSWIKKEQKVNCRNYNYTELIDKIIEYVVDMNYTHIELLPILEHPFDGSWGYQITGYYSVTSRYGNPEDFMYLVDKCHQNGIGVILDWVPGHFCKDEHGLYRFDGTPLYESNNPKNSENYEWGTAYFDFTKPEIRSFLISNALFWLEKYHIDGLRVDAVSYMLYLDAGKEEGEWEKNKYGGRENIDAIEFIRKLNKAVFQYFPNALMIAEESTAWPLVTSPIYLGGLGFNFKWNMGWMNDMLKFMEMDPLYRKWHHNLITFSFTYAFSENYVLPLSHDEVVHGKKSLLDKMPGDYWQKFANLRLLYSYMIAHPGKKLLFMGGEYGQFIEWDYKKSLDWFLLDYDMHSKTHEFVKLLNSFYLEEKPLYELDNDHKGFEWIDHQNYEQSVITFMRLGKEDDDFIVAIFNFTPIVNSNYRIGVPKLGEYIEVFNSDRVEFGGSGVINSGKINAKKEKWHNQDYHVEIRIPPLGAIFLKSVD